LGQVLGRAFDQARDPIAAYSLNVGASLAGIWAFSALAFLYQPPWVWVLLSLLLLLPLFERRSSRLVLGGLVAAGAAAFVLTRPAPDPGREALWSPYQKLELSPIPTGSEIRVNEVGYMVAVDLSDRAIAARHPDPAERAVERTLNQYDLPFAFAPGARTALL